MGVNTSTVDDCVRRPSSIRVDHYAARAADSFEPLVLRWSATPTIRVVIIAACAADSINTACAQLGFPSAIRRTPLPGGWKRFRPPSGRSESGGRIGKDGIDSSGNRIYLVPIEPMRSAMFLSPCGAPGSESFKHPAGGEGHLSTGDRRGDSISGKEGRGSSFDRVNDGLNAGRVPEEFHPLEPVDGILSWEGRRDFDSGDFRCEVFVGDGCGRIPVEGVRESASDRPELGGVFHRCARGSLLLGKRDAYPASGRALGGFIAAAFANFFALHGRVEIPYGNARGYAAIRNGCAFSPVVNGRGYISPTRVAGVSLGLRSREPSRIPNARAASVYRTLNRPTSPGGGMTSSARGRVASRWTGGPPGLFRMISSTRARVSSAGRNHSTARPYFLHARRVSSDTASATGSNVHFLHAHSGCIRLRCGGRAACPLPPCARRPQPTSRLRPGRVSSSFARAQVATVSAEAAGSNVRFLHAHSGCIRLRCGGRAACPLSPRARRPHSTSRPRPGRVSSSFARAQVASVSAEASGSNVRFLQAREGRNQYLVVDRIECPLRTRERVGIPSQPKCSRACA